MNIIVVGSGYVGLSNAVLLAQRNNVTIVDIDKSKVDLLQNKKSPIDEEGIKDYLLTKSLNLQAKLSREGIFSEADYIVIATPTDYDPDTNYFNTQSIESVIEQVLKENTRCSIIIKSTIPVGYTESLRKQYNTNRIIFSPEFLREGRALEDNLYPSRIILGCKSEAARAYAQLVSDAALSSNTPVLFMGATEAEAVKLFSNTYLAMRVAYFNELDSFAYGNNLNAKEIIDGVVLDPRIGSNYNNPSFGYGGYCFPKDTKQMVANFKGIPNNLISAVVESNETRKQFITQSIIDQKSKTVGIYRLIMKSGSDNYRSSAILDVIHKLENNDIDVRIYEPSISEWDGKSIIENNLTKFKNDCDLIVANRVSEEIADVNDKVFTRDVYEDN
ncbi:nucleotide sugar dehydrogenase [Kangiella marina]|uniref:UDP-glucose 6-dehydrogenase n=1 Tax=Kangiella marina TaxID=1079178 RepID=A0ABP8IPE6_9GAMM